MRGMADKGSLTAQEVEQATMHGVLKACGLVVCFGVVALVTVLMVGGHVKNDARERMMSWSCMTNERIVSIALLMYSNDYDGYLPSSKSAGDAYLPSAEASWPTDEDHGRPTGKGYDPAWLRNPRHCPTGHKYQYDSRLAGVAESSVRSDDVTVTSWRANPDDAMVTNWRVMIWEGSPDALQYPHSGRGNFAFVDSHTKALSPKEANDPRLWYTPTHGR